MKIFTETVSEGVFSSICFAVSTDALCLMLDSYILTKSRYLLARDSGFLLSFPGTRGGEAGSLLSMGYAVGGGGWKPPFHGWVIEKVTIDG